MRLTVLALFLAGCGSSGASSGADATPQPRPDAALASPDAALPDATVSAADAAPRDAGPDATPILASHCAAANEGFTGTAIDWGCWDDYFTHDGTIAQAGALILTPSGSTTYSSAQLGTSYAFTGDFDVSVSYALGAGWNGAIASPAGAHLDVTLEAFADSTHHVVLARSKASGGNEQVYGTSVGPQSGSQFVPRPYAGTSGKLRLTRSGTKLAVRADLGSGWTEITTFDFPAEPTHIILGAASIDIARSFTATLDDFTIASGATDFAPYVDKPYQPRADLALGTVPNDYLAGREWGDHWTTTHPLDALAANGLSWVRVGVTTVSSSLLATTPRARWPALGWHDEFWSSREFAEAILDDALAHGMRLEVFLFLSNSAAHAGMQNAPPEWAGLSVDDTAAAIEDYTYATAKHYADEGFHVEVYDIGNEIDTGIVNFRPGDRIPIPAGTDILCDAHWMRDNVWTTEAKLLAAAIAGVRRASPGAKIVLHTTGMIGLCLGVEGPAFFDAMVDLGVDFDIGGLSFYPLGKFGAGPWFQRAQALAAHLAKLGKKTIIAETAYPHAAAGVAGSPLPGFAFTPAGQADWMRASLRFASRDPDIAGWFYFYPDWYPGLMNGDPGTLGLESSGLFETETTPEPALLAVPQP